MNEYIKINSVNKILPSYTNIYLNYYDESREEIIDIKNLLNVGFNLNINIDQNIDI